MGQPGEKVLTALPANNECIRIGALSKATGIPKRRLVNLIATLTRSGLVTAPKIGCYRRTPKGDKFIADGKAFRSGPTMPSGPRPSSDGLRARAWHALRMLKKATLPEIIEIADAGAQKSPSTNLYRYFAALIRAGVMAKLDVREAGAAMTSNGFVRWSLIRDLGPAAPVLRHGGVYDPNRETMIEPAAEVTK
jgi:predicted transcriptional regulator